MPERRIINRTIEFRNVFTLFVTLNGQELKRVFTGLWVTGRHNLPDPNVMGRQVDAELRTFCEQWNVTEPVTAISVYDTEQRTTEEVQEVEHTRTEHTRRDITFDPSVLAGEDA